MTGAPRDLYEPPVVISPVLIRESEGDVEVALLVESFYRCEDQAATITDLTKLTHMPEGRVRDALVRMARRHWVGLLEGDVLDIDCGEWRIEVYNR